MLFPTLHVLTLCSLLAWFYLALFHGRFWRVPELDTMPPAPPAWPGVTAIVPARDEEEVLGTALGSLLAQNYPGEFAVILVNDQSEDGTETVAHELATDSPVDLIVLDGQPRPDGWAGKLWALHQGQDEAARRYPGHTYAWHTDADILHDPQNLRRLVSKALAEGLVLNSQMVRLRSNTWVERFLIPPFVFFFQMLYPFPWVNDPTRRMAAAAGGSLLVKSETLRAAGGIAAIRDRIIDDCALAQLLKPFGKIRLELSAATRSIRTYETLSEIWRMVVRTAFVQLRHSFLLLIVAVLGMVFLYALHPLIVVFGLTTGQYDFVAVGLTGWIIMIALFAPTLRLYDLPVVLGVALPVAALLYVAMTVDSARRYISRHGPEWKGRRYSK